MSLEAGCRQFANCLLLRLGALLGRVVGGRGESIRAGTQALPQAIIITPAGVLPSSSGVAFLVAIPISPIPYQRHGERFQYRCKTAQPFPAAVEPQGYHFMSYEKRKLDIETSLSIFPGRFSISLIVILKELVRTQLGSGAYVMRGSVEDEDLPEDLAPLFDADEG